MAREIARQWFISGDGIDRHVISADIQRYLGNDATVRPGVGNGDNEVSDAMSRSRASHSNDTQGVHGYWIKAYRNLTTAMLADLRADSLRWRQEQRATGGRGSHSPASLKAGITVPDPIAEPYVGSETYNLSSAGRQPDRRHGDSPVVDSRYGAAQPRERERERPLPGRPVDRMNADRMDIDPPVAQPDRRYGQPDRGHQPDPRGAYPTDARGYPVDARGYPIDPRTAVDPRTGYPMDQSAAAAAAYGRAPVTSYAQQDPRYASAYPPNDGAPPGFVRQGNYYVPISTYETAPAMTAGRSDMTQYPGAPYGQPPAGRDARDPRQVSQMDYADPRADPRNDPRYAYPSPAATTISVAGTHRDTVTSPPQPSGYPMSGTTYDQFGRPVMQNPGQPERAMPPARDARESRDPGYGRERERERERERDRERERPSTNAGGADGHRNNRRRIG